MSLIERCTDGIVVREIAGELVAANLRTSKYLSLNKSGAKLWAALESPRTEAALVQMLVAAYDIDEMAAEADVDAFVASLIDVGLATRTSA